jgi:branched-chain amino acid transport system ATP-binding protein
MALLEIKALHKSFGGVDAIDSLDLHIEQGEVVSVIGPNGAGKTTFFNLVTGMIGADSGEIFFNGMDIVGLVPSQILQHGIARTFQNVRLFAEMSVRENVMVARHCRTKSGLLGAILRTPGFRAEEEDTKKRAEESLSFFGTRLVGYRFDQPAMSLSYANRRRLEIARAMASDPKLILLDEPTAGMNPRETKELTELIGKLRDERGFTIVLIEHDMQVVKGVSDRVAVLDHGKKIAEGSYGDVARDERVIEAYLGTTTVSESVRPEQTGLAPRSDGRVILELKGVNAHYGPVQVLRDVNIEIKEGEIACLLGGNASGKTTTLKTILGYLKPTSGKVVLDGETISGQATQTLVEKGVSMVPENRRLFHRMTVRENLELGSYLRKDKAIAEDLERILDLFPRVKERLSQRAGTLSGGEQQMVAMARALMARPKVLLMDEPSMGLAPILVAQNFEIIKQINERGTTIFVVEQNANMALSIADRGYVLQTGRIVLADTAEELLNNPQMRQAYLGEVR